MMGAAISASAQSGTNSPYSQYGIGVLADQTSGFNRGMNGVGLGFHEHNQINFSNPASYSAIDSLSFIFDAGLSLQMTNFSENGVKKNANNADLEYIVAGFRATKHLGVSFGLLPFSNVGYSYSYTDKVYDDENGSAVSSVVSHSGNGGMHQIYLGAGWEPIKGFSFGANLSYFWGQYNRSTTNSFTESSISSVSRVYSANVNSWKLDIGAQYTAKINDNDAVTVGATFSPGHKLKASANLGQYNTSTQYGTDTTTFTINNALELPTMYGAGFMWNHQNRVKVGFDYTAQNWSSIDYPTFVMNGSESQYVLKSGVYKNRQKYNLGVDFVPNERKRQLYNRIHYRMGVSYATPYITVNGNDGPKEISASLGFGIPITNGYNNRSQLNISGQFVHNAATGLIKENIFKINVGFTFNERWFMKWKVE